MKEIKFRCWYNNQMYKVNSIDFSNELINLNGADIIDFEEGILMQYTGLKDKNGIEIYENDILKAHRVYKGENAGNDYKTVKWENRNCGCGFNISPRISDSYEVIGNIYDKEMK